MRISFDKGDINFYFSFQCPYSFITWRLLSDILRDNEKVSLNPINIGIAIDGWNKYSYMNLWGGERWLRLSREAQSLGIKISKPLNIFNEELVARAIESYENTGAEYYISTVFKAVFISNLDISISNVIRYFLQSEGNDSDIFMEALGNENTLIKYKNNLDLWHKKRIRLLPTIEIGTDRISGFVKKRQIEDFLRPLLE